MSKIWLHKSLLLPNAVKSIFQCTFNNNIPKFTYFPIFTNICLFHKNMLYCGRCARAQAEWSNDGMVKVTKVVKGLLQHFGCQDKNGIFLYPEEALFLLETVSHFIKYTLFSFTKRNSTNFDLSLLLITPLYITTSYYLYHFYFILLM